MPPTIRLRVASFSLKKGKVIGHVFVDTWARKMSYDGSTRTQRCCLRSGKYMAMKPWSVCPVKNVMNVAAYALLPNAARSWASTMRNNTGVIFYVDVYFFSPTHIIENGRRALPSLQELKLLMFTDIYWNWSVTHGHTSLIWEPPCA